jgi:hypothetical protein
MAGQPAAQRWEDRLLRPRDPPGLAGQVSAHVAVLADFQLIEDVAHLRHVADAEPISSPSASTRTMARIMAWRVAVTAA